MSLFDWKRKVQWFVPSFIGMDSGGGGGGDGGAAAREAARQQKIAEGTAAVNNAFTGFDDPYYGNISKMYKDNYTPLIQEQYQTALRQLPYQFANTQGSEYQRRVGELERDYQRQLVDNASAADDFANQRRTNVENQRQSLINQVTAGADPGSAATLASGAAKSLSAQPTFSALGDLFAKYTGNVVNAAGINNQQTPGGYTPLTFGGGRSGAMKVVGG